MESRAQNTKNGHQCQSDNFELSNYPIYQHVGQLKKKSTPISMICLVFQLAKFAKLLLTVLMFVYTLVLLHKTRSVFLDVFLIWGYLFKFKWHPQRADKGDIWLLWKCWPFWHLTVDLGISQDYIIESAKMCWTIRSKMSKERIIHNSYDVSFSETHLQVQTHVRMQGTKNNVNRCPRQPKWKIYMS